MRITNCSVGDPMGFKVNETSELDLDALVKALEIYHGNRYIIGYDKSFVDTPHYHINWFACKPVSESARKTFRNALSKKFPYLTKADKLYTGEVLASADPNRWIAYAIKETLISVSGIEITDEIKILSKSCFENKRQNKVYSEKKANEEKEKKSFKANLLSYVRENIDSYEIPENQRGAFRDGDKVHLLVIKFLKENERYGSLTRTHIESYARYCNINIYGWDECLIYRNVYNYGN